MNVRTVRTAAHAIPEPTMLHRIFPSAFDNRFSGHPLALWLLAPIAFLKVMAAQTHIFNADGGAQSISTIPLDTYPTAAAQNIVGLFARMGLEQLVIALLLVLALVRYRSMIPLLYLMLVAHYLALRAISSAKPLVFAGTSGVTYLSLAIAVLSAVGFVLSLYRRDRTSGGRASARVARISADGELLPLPQRPMPLSLLAREPALAATEWLRGSVTTFATSVASFLPGQFEAYVRVYHPFDLRGAPVSWHELVGPERRDSMEASELAYNGVPGAQARSGSLPELLVAPLVEHLRAATTTPDACCFALWEGGDSPVPIEVEPTLRLPHRAYHLLTGTVADARVSLSGAPFGYHSANLWWPADHAWCVATEVDLAWTYVGASRACIDALLADPRLETVETSAGARW